MNDVKTHLEKAILIELDEQWKASLRTWEDAPPVKMQANFALLKGLRNRLLNVLKEIEDPIEISHAIAIYHLELKCHWNLLNLKLQYQVNKTGEVSQEILYRANGISYLIDAVKPFVAESALEHCKESLFS